jgi:branched-chain amino acid transport system ATP-binding protein
VLQIHNLHVYYGKSHILRGVNLHVRPGETVCLLGRNGSGRSTVLKAAMGLVAARGSVVFQKREILGLPAFAIAQLGLGYVAENRDIFPTLSVHQNLLMGEKRGESRSLAAEMYAQFPLLQARQHTAAGRLSGGEQQMLALCRTLMGRPSVVMIDEPTEGLAPQTLEWVAQCLKTLQNRGVAVLLVEQKLTLALQISHRCCVIGHGQVVFEGTPEALRNAPGVQKEWLQV